MFKEFWSSLSEAVFSPKADETEIIEKLQIIKEQLPTPVFWLLGKTQSGKTSLIRALTGRNDAEIGNGFQSCTRTARLYDFPDSEQCLIRFLDTRGLGEVNYDPTEDLQLFKQQAHLLIVVMKALDHAQQEVVATLRMILKEKPNWPIIVVQTNLHEGYPEVTTEHLLPYPYQDNPLPSQIPQDLTRSLLKQRQLFKGMDAQFVPIDFTLPQDGFSPVYYGLESLWTAIEQAVPLGLRGMIAVSEQREPLQDLYATTAHPHIIVYALLSGGAAAIPIPFVDIPLVLSIHAKMFHTLASIYNQELTKQRVAEISGLLGFSFALRWGGRELIKFIPVYGTIISSVATAAMTYALGKTLCAYFSYGLGGDLPDKTAFEKIYAEELERGEVLLKDYFKNSLKK